MRRNREKNIKREKKTEKERFGYDIRELENKGERKDSNETQRELKTE